MSKKLFMIRAARDAAEN